MAKEKKTQSRKKGISKVNLWSIPLRKYNFRFFLAGLILLLIGFYIMTIGPWDSVYALTISPIILLLAYFIIFPLGILNKEDKK